MVGTRGRVGMVGQVGRRRKGVGGRSESQSRPQSQLSNTQPLSMPAHAKKPTGHTHAMSPSTMAGRHRQVQCAVWQAAGSSRQENVVFCLPPRHAMPHAHAHVFSATMPKRRRPVTAQRREEPQQVYGAGMSPAAKGMEKRGTGVRPVRRKVTRVSRQWRARKAVAARAGRRPNGVGGRRGGQCRTAGNVKRGSRFW